MTHEQAVALIEASDLKAEAHALITMLRPSIRIRTEAIDSQSDSRASRFGGLRLLPPSMSWPGLSLSLLAQIKMTDLLHISSDLDLPATGRLLFFYDAGEQPWGFDPDHRRGWKVLHVADENNLQVVEPPQRKLQAEVFPTCALNFEVEQTIPKFISKNGIELSIYENEAFEQLHNALDPSRGDIHRMGGYADELQGDMQLECQLVSNGIDCGNQDGYRDPRRATLELGASDWRLLLQLDSDEKLKWMWGDAGRLYFWIRKNDLRIGNFDNVWCVLQCG